MGSWAASSIASSAMLEVLQQLNSHQTKPTIQNHNIATYANKISKLDAKIDWSLPAVQIDRKLRAFIPTPVAFTQIFNLNANQQANQKNPTNNSITIRIWQAILPDLNQTTFRSTAAQSPGDIMLFNKHGIDVATGDGLIRLQKLQFPNGKILNTVDLFNSPKYKNFFEQHAKFN